MDGGSRTPTGIYVVFPTLWRKNAILPRSILPRFQPLLLLLLLHSIKINRREGRGKKKERKKEKLNVSLISNVNSLISW